MAKKPSRPGGSGRVKTVAPGQVIEGLASEHTPESAPLQETQEVQGVTEETKEVKATEAAVVAAEEKVVDVTPSEDAKVDVVAEAFEEGKLANGSKVSPDTVMQCGRCQARFYAKDAPKGECPATDAFGNVCGGVLGPVAA